MKIILAKDSPVSKGKILDKIKSFNSSGRILAEGRNTIRIFKEGNLELNVKSFRSPNAVNKFVYRYFRKSKAQRSFEYASILRRKGIGTPRPIAYAEEPGLFLFDKSYYICEHLECDLTFRELKAEDEDILRAFTHFTFELHEKQVEFLDHSPGNTLIKKNEEGNYSFYLVDLNRMRFKNLSFDERMRNFSRLTPQEEMIRIMANEYAKLVGKPEELVFSKMWGYTQEFQEKFQRKKRLKKALKFYK